MTMKRPVLHMVTPFAAGIITAWYIRQVCIVIVLFMLLMILYVYLIKKKVRFMKNLFLWGIFLLLGYLHFALQYTSLSAPLQPYYETEVNVKGFVCDVYQADADKTIFHFFVESLESENREQTIRRTIRVNAYDLNADNNIILGSFLEIHGVVKKPSGVRNPGGFNYAAWLFSKKAAGTMAAGNQDIFVAEAMKKLPVKALGYKVRTHVITSLENMLTYEKAALMTAMLTGYRENLAESMEEAFRASGLLHIMAVSGANIAFLLFPLLWLFRILCIHRKVAAGATIPVLIFYCFVTGMEASVLRASVMAIVIMAGKILDRKSELMNSIGIAAFILLLINPLMLFDVGFQLSVGATLGLALLYRRILNMIPKKVPKTLRETAAATMAAQAGVLPLLIQYFSKVSLVSILSNLFVIPLTGLATVMGMLAVIINSISRALGTWIGYMLQGVLHIILVVTDFFASIPWAEVNMHHFQLPWFGLYYSILIIAGVYGMAFFVRYKKAIAAGLFLLGLVLILEGLYPDRLKVIFIDVGQGDSTFVQTTDGFHLLIDGGGSYFEKETGYIGKQVLFPLLMHEGVHTIDKIIISHAHADHYYGVLTLIDVFPVKSIGLPEYSNVYEDFSELLDVCEKKGISTQFYSQGDTISIGEKTVFKVMHPSKGYDYEGNLNNTSLSGFLEYGELQILFAGDMEQDAECAFLRCQSQMDCDILKVAHHGGKNSTTEQFLLQTMPEISVISVGKNNFGHPSDIVSGRLNSIGAKIYTTLKNGAVIVESDGETYRVKKYYKDERFIFLFEKNRLN